MKKTATIIVLILIVAAFGGALYYFYQKNNEPPVTYNTEKPQEKTIIKKTVATGKIIPREEIPIKPNISGIMCKIYVKAGDKVKRGDLIAQIEVVPDVNSLNSAKNQIQTAKINMKNQKKVFERQEKLFKKGVISENEFDNAVNQFEIAKQNLEAARENFEIVKTGTTTGIGDAALTKIKSTINGMVLDVPVKEGNQVIQANNFNEGTTIANVADINDMIFEGKVDESEVGKIEEGLPLEITVGAIENKVYDATLDYIAPQGVEENSAVQFKIEGSLNLEGDTFVRAGLSANASIILDKSEDVLALKEALIQFDDETNEPYVEIKTGDKKYKKQDVELGISNGIFVEVKSGIEKDDEIKVWRKIKSSPKNRYNR